MVGMSLYSFEQTISNKSLIKLAPGSYLESDFYEEDGDIEFSISTPDFHLYEAENKDFVLLFYCSLKQILLEPKEFYETRINKNETDFLFIGNDSENNNWYEISYVSLEENKNNSKYKVEYLLLNQSRIKQLVEWMNSHSLFNSYTCL